MSDLIDLHGGSVKVKKGGRQEGAEPGSMATNTTKNHHPNLYHFKLVLKPTSMLRAAEILGVVVRLYALKRLDFLVGVTVKQVVAKPAIISFIVHQAARMLVGLRLAKSAERQPPRRQEAPQLQPFRPLGVPPLPPKKSSKRPPPRPRELKRGSCPTEDCKIPDL